MNRSSDASRPSPAARLATAGTPSSLKKPGHESPPTASAPHSRTTSPIRLFNWSGFHHSHEDAFVPVDPFRLRTRLRRLSLLNSDLEHHVPFDPTCEGNPFCCLPPWRCSSEDRFFTFLRDTRYFMLDTLPRQIYLHLLFRLPSLYFSRIARVYEDAQLSKPDLEHMIDSYCNPGQQEQRERIVRSSPIPPGAHFHPASALPFPDEWTAANVSPALIRFKQSWETFIDSLLREWKTLNLVSALLNSSVFTIFQVLPRISMILIKLVDRAVLSMFQSQTMANDPVIRTAALLSLASAIMSLSYGCIYIVRFGTMRSMYKAARWAEVGVSLFSPPPLSVLLTHRKQRGLQHLFYGMCGCCWPCPLSGLHGASCSDHGHPICYLSAYAWPCDPSKFQSRYMSQKRSMIFFIVAILAFVWRYGSSADPASPPLLSPTAAIGPRVAVSALFFVGLLYLAAMVKTLHSYGRTKEKRLFRRPSIGSGMRDTGEPDARGERGGQRGRGMTRNLGRDGDRRDSPRMNGGHGSTKHGREQMETGALSAVMGLGLTGLDEFASPRSSEEMPAEKPGHQTPASV